MNHPAPETWVSYVYDELDGSPRADAEAHLRICPHCKQSVERLRSTLVLLDQDKASLVLPRPGSTPPAWRPVVRWALAASVVLAAGFLAGRASGPSRSEVQQVVAAARQELQVQFREELQALATVTITAAAEENRRLLGEFARDLQAGQAADRRDLLAALDTLDQRRALDSEALRAGLITLARRTGSGFQHTESQLNFLASYLPSETGQESLNPSSSQKQP